MNKLVLLSAAGAAVLLASGCATDGAYVGGDVGVSRLGPGELRQGGVESRVQLLANTPSSIALLGTVER
jgi:hypothetical protein